MKKLITIMILLSISLYNGLKADEPIRKFSEFTLAENDTLKNDVIIFKGDAKIDGVVQGNLSVYAGDIYLGKNSTVTGEIKAYAGKVYRDEKVDEASSYYIVNKLKGFVFRDPSDGIEFDELESDDDDGINISVNVDNKKYYNFFSKREVLPRSLFSYNKAEGLYLGLGTDMNIFTQDYLDIGMFASGGYAFREKAWKYYLQEQFGFFNQNFVLGAVQYNNTLTEDGWKLDFDLNTLASATIHEDFYNYYGSTGYGFYTGSAFFYHGEIPFNIGWKASYYHDKIREMNNATNYSLFSNGKDFAPAMELNREGNMKTVSTTLFMDIGNKKSNKLQMAGIFETTLNSAEQNFRYEKVTGILSGRVQLGEFFYLAEKLRMESASAYSNDTSRSVPVFKLTSLGGTGTLPGYSLNSIWGNKALISRTTLGFSESYLKDLCFMLDIGDAWEYKSNDLLGGFDKISLNQMKKSFGIGYLLGKHTILSVHKRLDTSHNPYQMQLTSNMSVDEILNFDHKRSGKVKKINVESIIDDVGDGLDNADESLNDTPKIHKKKMSYPKYPGYPKLEKMKFKWDDQDDSDDLDDDDKKFFDHDEESEDMPEEPLKKSEE